MMPYEASIINLQGIRARNYWLGMARGCKSCKTWLKDTDRIATRDTAQKAGALSFTFS